MEHWGKTKAGTPRFFCSHCKISEIRDRDDVERRHSVHQLRRWLGGKSSLYDIAAQEGKTRQALWKEFHPLFSAIHEPEIPFGTKTRHLIVDGTYIHGHTLCALVGIDENDNLYWHFAPWESYNKSWIEFLSRFAEPQTIIMDGQKGLFAAARTLWPHVPVQRCQFHVISFALQYLGRKPREQVGKDLLAILYSLKDAKTVQGRDEWLRLYRLWEEKYSHIISAKDRDGRFVHPRLRSTRLIIRKALPYLFTFLERPGVPNTTNLVEGWVNGAMAEALRFHRGLRMHQKQALASVVLSNLKRRGRRPASPVSPDQQNGPDTLY